MPRTGGVFSLLSGSKGTPNTSIQSAPYNAQLDDFAADANAARPITAGGTGATTASGARTALGLAVGSDVQAYDAFLQSIAGLTTVADRMIYTTGVDTAAVTTITSYGRSLIDDADAATARTTLGLVIGTNVQAFDADLTAFAAVTIAANQIAYGTGAATWGVTSLTAFARTILDDADAATVRTTIGAQASDAGLTAIAALAVTNGNFIVGDGTTWVAESGATARASLGLGTIATQNSNAVSITGGAVSGITDLAVADGGTGASNAAGAKTNLGITDDVQAWVNFNGTGTVAIRASRGVTSITDNGVGDYTINFSTPMADINYAALLMSASDDAGATNGYMPFERMPTTSTLSRTTSAFRIRTLIPTVGFADSLSVNAAFMR